MIDPAAWPIGELARAWRSAQPFAIAVIDGLLGPARLLSLRQDFAREPHLPRMGELYTHLTSAEPPLQPGLRDLLGALSSPPVLRAVEAITGKALQRAEGRSYVYLRGHYLLPHTDWREDGTRAVAFAFYAGDGEALRGGELELFRCELEGGEIARTEAALRIEPRADRLVLFDVSPASLHQIREVEHGARASIAGWFHR